MSDQQIIEAIKEHRADKAFVQLYRYFPVVKKMIASCGGSKEDARDVYQEALIILCKKIKEGNFVLSSKLDTYLYSVCNFLWKDELKKQKKQKYVDLVPEVEAGLKEELSITVEQEQLSKLAEKVVAGLGEKCRDILNLFYFQAISMKEIAKKMGFNSEQAAKNKKYKCLEEAKARLNTLKEKLV